ncbi:hypothetical protein AAVH_14536 [Aphelenchoides avenae]|nr:hypothetical protein AAVH_14917 [Aphelenchus avenae]KAH7718025.1 hypothetical protein AAVH_14536 [Aphelenchus avenae]
MKLWKGTELVDTVAIKRRSSTNQARAFTSLYLDHQRDSIRSVKLNFGDATDRYVADLFTYFPPLRFVKDIFVSNDLSPYATFPTDNVLNMLQMTKCLTRLELESVPRWFDWSILSLPEFRHLSRLCILRASSHDEVTLRSSDADELLTFSRDFSAVDSKTVRAPCFRLSQKCHKKLVEVLTELGGRSLTLELGSSIRSARKEDSPYSACSIAAEFGADVGTEVTRYKTRDGKVLFIDDGERFVGTNDAAKVEELANADQVPSV